MRAIIKNLCGINLNYPIAFLFPGFISNFILDIVWIISSYYKNQKSIVLQPVFLIYWCFAFACIFGLLFFLVFKAFLNCIGIRPSWCTLELTCNWFCNTSLLFSWTLRNEKKTTNQSTQNLFLWRSVLYWFIIWYYTWTNNIFLHNHS